MWIITEDDELINLDQATRISLRKVEKSVRECWEGFAEMKMLLDGRTLKTFNSKEEAKAMITELEQWLTDGGEVWNV